MLHLSAGTLECGMPQIVFKGAEGEILIEPKLDASKQVPDVCQGAAHPRVSSFHWLAFVLGRYPYLLARTPLRHNRDGGCRTGVPSVRIR